MLLTATALLATLLASQAGDTTVAVSKGTRLSVNNHAGRITVTAWNRDEVQIRSVSSDDDADIRVDLLVIWPVVGLVSAWAMLRALRRRDPGA